MNHKAFFVSAFLCLIYYPTVFAMNLIKQEINVSRTASSFDVCTPRNSFAVRLQECLNESTWLDLESLLKKTKGNVNIMLEKLVEYPIHLAARKTPPSLALKMVQLLVKAGADVNRENYANHTALAIAASRGNVDLVHYLLDNKATYGRGIDSNPYSRALLNLHVGVVQALIEKGITVTNEELKQAQQVKKFCEKDNAKKAGRALQLIENALKKQKKPVKQNSKYKKLS